MKRAILRVDDIHGATKVSDLQAVYGACWEKGIPVCLSVIPRAAYSFGEGDPVPDWPLGIEENPRLVSMLGELWRGGLVEVALHGLHHHYGELARDSEEQARDLLEAALADLRRALPEVPIRVLVPPHDHLSRAGLRAACELDLGVCSTLAAVGGGTRAAHWWARARRWWGWSFAPASAGRWPTDVSLLDFEESASDDWPVTERLLRLAGRWRTPAVFVQHYWRLLDRKGRPNERHERWVLWLARVTARPDVRFERFCDG